MDANKVESVQEYVNKLYSKGLIDINFTSMRHRDIIEVETIVHNTWNAVKDDAELIEARSSLLLSLDEAVLLVYGER